MFFCTPLSLASCCPAYSLIHSCLTFRLSELAAEFGCLLVVDDTIANFANAALLRAPGLRVDMLCSSLTKTFSGKGNVMAGSVLLNTELGERSASLRRIFDGLQACHDLPALSLQDAVVLEENSRSTR